MPDRHSFTRKPDEFGETFCKRCGLRRRRREGKKQYLDRMGWVEHRDHPSCRIVRFEADLRRRGEWAP